MVIAVKFVQVQGKIFRNLFSQTDF